MTRACHHDLNGTFTWSYVYYICSQAHKQHYDSETVILLYTHHNSHYSALKKAWAFIEVPARSRTVSHSQTVLYCFTFPNCSIVFHIPKLFFTISHPKLFYTISHSQTVLYYFTFPNWPILFHIPNCPMMFHILKLLYVVSHS